MSVCANTPTTVIVACSTLPATMMHIGTLPHPNLEEGYVLNDETLAILNDVALSHARPAQTSLRPVA